MIWFIIYEIVMLAIFTGAAWLGHGYLQYLRWARKQKFVQKEGRPNEVMPISPSGRDYISYNPRPHKGRFGLESDGRQPETAMCIDGRWYVLIGDHREAYMKAIRRQGMFSCHRFFRKMEPEWGSTWSSHDASVEKLKRWLEARREQMEESEEGEEWRNER